MVYVRAEYNATSISIHNPEVNHAAAGNQASHEKNVKYIRSVFAQASNNIYGTTAVWLGLHNPGGWAGWQWVDNSTYNYANWTPDGETNCGISGGDCHALMSTVNGTGFGKWTGYVGGGPDYEGYETVICVRPALY